MEEWKESIIEDTSIQMIDGDRGKNYPKNSDFFSQGYCLFLNAGNVTKTGFSFSENSFITENKDRMLRKGRLERNDVVITTRGTVGNVALYDSSVPYEHLRINSGMLILKGGRDILPEYLYYFLKGKRFQAQLSLYVSGTAQPQLPKSTLGKMMISFPVELNVQKKVCGILKSLDDKIAVNKKICENLEAQAQALFKHWFVDFAPFKDGKFVESELGLIPEGWRVGTLGDIVREVKKKVGSSDAKVLSPINTGKLVLSDEFFTKQVYSKSISKYIVVEPNDFAYNPARVNIGSIGRNEFDFIGCVSPVYVVFHCHENYHYFIDFFRKTQYFKNNVNKLAIGGVRQTLRYEDMARIPMVIPQVEIVVSFNDIYESMYVTLKQLHSENLRLATLRDTLLPKLMSGQIKL